MLPKLLQRIKRFTNCNFSASLYGDGKNFIAYCNWQGEGEDGANKVYELDADDQEDAINIFVEMVQTLRKIGHYDTY